MSTCDSYIIFSIVKSADLDLQERVVFVAIEAEDHEYENTINSKATIYPYPQNVSKIGFRQQWAATEFELAWKPPNLSRLAAWAPALPGLNSVSLLAVFLIFKTLCG